MTSQHRSVAVSEASQPSAVRFAAREIAETAGFNESDAHRAGLVATELATNLVKHTTQGGEILLRITSNGSAPEIECISIDRGPGIRDVAQCQADGHSTAGSPGNGLGAVQRLSDEFDLYSQVDRGTIVFSRLRAKRSASGLRGAFEVAGVCVAVKGEECCGDAWDVRHEAFGSVLIVADGLGHGLHASEAAVAAIGAVTSRPFAGTVSSLEEIHNGLRHTRGAAAIVVELCRGQPIVKVAGIGNIATAIYANGAVRQGVSLNGTLGHQVRQFREYTYPWDSNGLLVLSTDGLATHWSLDDYRGLKQHHPAVVAAALYRDHSRQRDDVTVVVCREAA